MVITNGYGASLMTQTVKNLPIIQETQVWFLGGEDPLEKGIAARSRILVWKILWTEEPGDLCSLGLQRVRHNWETENNSKCLGTYLSRNADDQSKKDLRKSLGDSGVYRGAGGPSWTHVRTATGSRTSRARNCMYNVTSIMFKYVWTCVSVGVAVCAAVRVCPRVRVCCDITRQALCFQLGGLVSTCDLISNLKIWSFNDLLLAAFWALTVFSWCLFNALWGRTPHAAGGRWVRPMWAAQRKNPARTTAVTKVSLCRLPDVCLSNVSRLL